MRVEIMQDNPEQFCTFQILNSHNVYMVSDSTEFNNTGSENSHLLA